MKRTAIGFLAALLVMSLVFVANAAVPQLINYQGRLTNSVGAPLDTTVALIFQIYADSNGVTSLWDETHPSVIIADGLFQVQLGSVTPIGQNVFTGEKRWLGVRLSGGPATALIPLVSTAYAYRSNVSDTASLAKSVADNSITSAKILNGTISFTDISQNSATSGQVMKWNGSAWTAQADATGGGSGGWSDNGTVIELATSTDTVALNSALRLGKLNVGGNMSLTAQSSIYWGTDSTYIKGWSGGDMTLQGEDIFARTTGSTYFADVDAGNFVEIDNANKLVGVGTTAPDERLQVENDAASGRSFLQLETSHATNFGETGIRFKTPQNTWHLRMDDYTNNNLLDGALGLRSQVGIEAMTWLENGNVGVGTTNPTRKLHVYGSAQIKDTLYGGYLSPSLISASRLPDEPGVASSVHTSDVPLTTSWQVITSRQITVPGAGYVLAIGNCDVSVWHGATGYDEPFAGISDVADGFPTSSPTGFYFDNTANAGHYGVPLPCQAIFQVDAAGTHEYYFLAKKAGDGSQTLRSAQFILMYVPTAYGTVSTTKSAGAMTPELGELLGKSGTESSIDPTPTDYAEELRQLRSEVEALKKRLDEQGK
jgi:hypothetical protein